MPRAEKVTIDADIVRMFSRQGFIDLFWEKLREARENNPQITHEEVFHCMNNRWKEVMGDFRFRSFESFRKSRDR
ncbi:MAG: hypothetical protein GT597_13865 [Bacteroidales bacterium]|nr:hypothetical protein [Bacteroidales bacterium]